MFEVGDKVRAFGVDGVVVSTTYSDDYPVKVEFIPLGMPMRIEIFDKQGKYMRWNKEPTLVLVEKAKKKVTKTIEKWANVYSDTLVFIYDTKRAADNNANIEDRIDCVRLTGTYEVEE